MSKRLKIRFGSVAYFPRKGRRVTVFQNINSIAMITRRVTEIKRPGQFLYNGWSYKCESCGICTQDYNMPMFWRINKGVTFEWLQCPNPKCLRKGNIYINKHK